MSLSGKTLFISGASRGIGLAIALRAARDGANVALIAKTAEPHPKLEGTVYTAAYDCDRRVLDRLWPDDAWSLSLDGFVEDARVRRSLVSVPPPTYAPASESMPSHPPALIF